MINYEETANGMDAYAALKYYKNIMNLIPALPGPAQLELLVGIRNDFPRVRKAYYALPQELKECLAIDEDEILEMEYELELD
jgi:hypothetical protein